MNIPYIPQTGKGADEHRNDCGAASACMVLGWADLPLPTVDTLYNEIAPSGDRYLSVGGLMAVLEKRGVDVEWDQMISNARLKTIVQSGSPCIALIKYGDLAKVRPNSFKGSHFVVVTDADDVTVTFHDPLNNVSSGANIKVTWAMWADCWTGLDDDNPDRGAIICTKVAAQAVPSDEVTVVTDWANVRLDPSTKNKEIGTVKTGQKLKKAGDVLPGTGIVIGWQPVIMYVATGVKGEPPYLK